jgi:hypothetical protein
LRDEIRPGACNVERKRDHLVGDLAVLGQDQQVARLGGDLELIAERPVPVHGRVEHLDDFGCAHRRCEHRWGSWTGGLRGTCGLSGTGGLCSTRGLRGARGLCGGYSGCRGELRRRGGPTRCRERA